MPTYKNLLELIRKGTSPREIYRKLEMKPSNWRRMINGSRFQNELAAQEDLASLVAGHRILAGANEATERLLELMDSQNAEAARKTCVAILNEAMQSQTEKTEKEKTDSGKLPAGVEPWMLLTPPDEDGNAADGPADQAADMADESPSPESAEEEIS